MSHRYPSLRVSQRFYASVILLYPYLNILNSDAHHPARYRFCLFYDPLTPPFRPFQTAYSYCEATPRKGNLIPLFLIHCILIVAV